MSTEKMEPVAYEEFEQYWDARWLDTQALRDQYKDTPVKEIAWQAWEACAEYLSDLHSSQLQAAVAAERERCAKVAVQVTSPFGEHSEQALVGKGVAAAIRQLGDEQ